MVLQWFGVRSLAALIHYGGWYVLIQRGITRQLDVYECGWCVLIWRGITLQLYVYECGWSATYRTPNPRQRVVIFAQVDHLTTLSM